MAYCMIRIEDFERHPHLARHAFCGPCAALMHDDRGCPEPGGKAVLVESIFRPGADKGDPPLVLNSGQLLLCTDSLQKKHWTAG